MRLVMALLVLGLSAPLVAGAQSSTSKLPKSSSPLAQPYAMTMGDVAALSMTAYASVIRATSGGYDAPVIVTFNRETQQLVIRIFGARSGLEEAKSSVNRFRNEVQPMLTAYVAVMTGVQIDDSQISLAYLDRNQTKEIVRYEGGRYVVSQ